MTYNEFIQNIIDTRGQWNIPDDEYFEAHHIIPKCFGGLPKHHSMHYQKHKNIIWLYPEEHYLAHELLAEEYPTNNKLVNAFYYMSMVEGENSEKYKITAEQYAKAKKLYSESISGKNHKKLSSAATSKTANEKRSKSLKGRIPWNKGLSKNTDDRVKNMSAKISKTMKGVPKGEAHRLAVIKALDGKVVSGTAGKARYTNGKQIRYFIEGQQPEGFWLARKVKEK